MDIKQKLIDLGYTIEVLNGVGITVIKAGVIKLFGTDLEIEQWLKENGEL